MNVIRQKFVVTPSWQIVLKDLGLAPQAVLRQAGLPQDLFSQSHSSLTIQEYFRYWLALETLFSHNPAFPLAVAQTITVEAFSPPIFACICSENLNVALKRLAQYKPLIGPLRLSVTQTEQHTQIVLGELPEQQPLPSSLVAMELVFFVHLARLATRDRIVPVRVQSTCPIPVAEAYEAFFGVPITAGEADSVVFAASDASKPFLTSNAGMWAMFEPNLNRRMQDLAVTDSFRDRVRACLVEILASGECSIKDVAQRLAVSTRTLQRRLQKEETSFQQELSSLRSELANYYLVNTPYSSAEISFLLGYRDSSSFFRAFHGWTGTTPEAFRGMTR